MSARYSILQLTVAQARAIAKDVGIRTQDWPSADIVDLGPAVLGAFEGRPAADYDHLSLGELAELVGMDEGADPNEPSATG